MLDKFPEKLRQLRIQHGLSQRQLARQLGIAESYIGILESRRGKPTAELVIKIASFFCVTTDVLMLDELDLDDELS